MYGNISITELFSRLHFLENHTRCQSDELAKKQQKIDEQTEEIKVLKEELNRLTEFLKLAGKKIYGSSTERMSEDYGQLSFYEDDEEQIVSSAQTKVSTYTRKKRCTLKEKLKNIPKTVVFHKLTDEEKICRECGEEMTVIGYDSFIQVEYIPAHLEVQEHRKEKAVCRKCSKKDENGIFAVAKAPSPLMERSYATPSLISHIICEKYVKAVPLYRIEKEFVYSGISISRQTMDNLMIAASDMLMPLYELIHRILLTFDIIHADETPMQVNLVKGRNKPVKGYMWVYRSGRYSEVPIILYEYRNGRKGEYPKTFLNGFMGYLHCDGLKQYDNVENITRAGCWAHLRRYFLNAVNVQSNKKDFSTTAGQGLMMINEIFRIEGRNPERPNEKSKYTLEEIAHIRNTKSKRLAENFFEWCRKIQGTGLPKNLTGKAIGYAIGQEKSLMNVFLDPRLELTNNAAERAVKPVVIGRKNWLFSHCERGARANAVLYSIIETAKENMLKPYEYIKWILESLKNMSFESFEDFLPWGDKIPDNLKIKSC